MQNKTPLDIRELKKKVHHLKPIVIIGTNGLTDAVVNEIEIALNFHELIKMKISAKDRDAKKALTQTICTKTQATLIHSIGNIIAIYRKRKN